VPVKSQTGNGLAFLLGDQKQCAASLAAGNRPPQQKNAEKNELSHRGMVIVCYLF
jgi:hypothetical protein